jgi:hypothetical protein
MSEDQSSGPILKDEKEKRRGLNGTKMIGWRKGMFQTFKILKNKTDL